ncbi:MAG: MFS transporter [Eubacteriales bacterium]|nr:MFS transporter [Eubacteriales bacterium]
MNQTWKRKFITIYAGQAFSLLGSAAAQFAVIWWLTVQSESALTLTMATVVAFLPGLFIGPFAGVWIDRYNRRTVMIAADTLVALSSAALAAAFLLQEAPPVWFIYAVLFVRGVGNTFHTPAMQAAIPMFVPVEMLTKAGGWGNLIVSVSTMLGPALGAVLMSAVPMAAVMLVDIAGAAFAVLCLLTVKIPDVPRREENLHFLEDLRQGIASFRENRPLMAVVFPVVIASLLYLPMSALYPLLVYSHYHGRAEHNAVVEVLFSGGLFVSSLAMGIWGGCRKRFLMISAAIGVMGISMAVGGALPPEAFWGFVFCAFVMGGAGTFFNVPLMAYIQESTKPEVMGKVMALLSTVMMLASPAGLLVAGPLSEAIGVDRWFLVSGAVMGAVGLWCFFATRRYDGEK